MDSEGRQPARDDRTPCVLVVDDEEWMRDACAEILQPEGFEVITAADGPTGLELMRRAAPDLILVDLKMPGMDGIAYLESVKALDPDIVAIMITGYATLEIAVEAMKAGAYDFLAKPFKPAELRAVARRGIEHRAAGRRVSALLAGAGPSSELHLAMLAHRFKAPLAAIRQCVAVVLAGYTGDISPRARGVIDLVAQRADQMLRFVDDWLTLSRLEQGTGIDAGQEVDLAGIVRDVVERVRQDPGSERITLRFDVARDPGTIRGDPRSLDELASNLIDNAVRYTPAGGTVAVEVDAGEAGAALSVRDTGPGIPAEDLERIFEPFYRGQAQKSIPGTGLGLPIVKRIAERHGGRVEVETAPGRGSLFRVLLPRPAVGHAEGAAGLRLAAGDST
jgi:signal transduction histidine kinase